MEEDAGDGLQQADADSYAIPYINVLQKGSKQCDTDQQAYIEGAKPGMFYNNVTRELYDSPEGILVVPCQFVRLFTEWVPRSAGGGLRGTYDPTDPIIDTCTKDERNKLHLPNGNEMDDTRYHFVLLLQEGRDPQAAVLPLRSSQIPKSKAWNTDLRNQRAVGKNGPYKPPTYAFVYRITAEAQQKDDKTWKGYVIKKERRLDVSDPVDAAIYLQGKEFASQVAKGHAKVATDIDSNDPEF